MLADFNYGWALAFLNLNDESGFPVSVVVTLRELGISSDKENGVNFKLIDAFSGDALITTNCTEPFEVRINPSGIVMLIAQPI